MSRLDTAKQPQAVKRLLRRNHSGEFFAEDGWTSNPEKAKTYTNVLEAAESCARHRLSQVELTLRLEVRGPDLFCTPMC